VSTRNSSPNPQHPFSYDALPSGTPRHTDSAGNVFNPRLEAELIQILENLGQLVSYHNATIQLEDRSFLRIVAQKGLPPSENAASSHPVAGDELYQAMVETRQPLIVRDAQRDRRRPWRSDLDHVQAWIGAPLLADGQVIGLITVGNGQPNTYGVRDAQTVAAFANQVVAIIENDRLSQRLSRSQGLYRTLQEVVALVNSTLDLDQVLNEILKQLGRILPYDSASIHLLRTNRLSYAAGRGFPMDSHPETELSAGENAIFQEIGHTKQSMVIDDVRQHPDWHTKPGLEYIRSWIGAPLVVKDEVIGYLTLDHSQVGTYTQEAVQIVDTLTRQVAIAIENARLYTETRRWAEEQAALNAVATAASSSLNLKKMLDHVLDAVQKLFDVDAAEVRLLAESGGALHVAARRSRTASTGFASSPVSNSDYATLAWRENRPVFTSENLLAEGRTEEPGEAVAAVPLRSKERLLGSLSIISYTSRRFMAREISLMEAIGYQLSLAIENAHLYEQLKESEARKTGLLHELEKSLQELQQAQAKLVQSEKLAAIGQLVSGVAHELNNPLTSIIGYAQILQSTDLPATTKADLNRIVEQAQRSARIVQNLLTFGRQHKPERRPVDVNQLIEDTLDLVSYQFKMDQVLVERHLSENIPLTMADPHQLQQVWLNLIQNAQQAMYDSHGGGVLRIQTVINHEGKIRVEFCDNGPGIAPDVMEKIFDPFFTTKPVGKGTGLGLSICYGIVQEHQGQIWGENNVQGGVTFVVELPVQEDDTWASYVKELLKPEASRSAKILVVDDEYTILELVDRLLTRQGYEVETAEDGTEAVEQIVQNDYDVILLDMLMPQKGGIATYREIVERRPELASRIIFATGDLATEDTRDFLEETRAGYIAKPFDLGELTRAIQAMLERQQK
jgi:signal transduction histidine kinase/ActR/RegA family two-component response regulator/putative methionine-R-sulfoxide reductase with GAF domain